jgi:hypothetical protein
MEEREENSRGAGCIIVGVVLIFLPVLYVLGIGPAALIAKNYPATDPWLEMLYLPVIALAEASVNFGNALGWYINLWTA